MGSAPLKTLILGGVRSGKSRWGTRLALESGLPVTYIASAEARDEEMHRRIAMHRAERPRDWTLIEEPRALAAALRAHAGPDRCVLVDCLTLWLAQLLSDGDETVFKTERDALLDTLPALAGHIILISNETGMGIVPLGELTRRYCDEAGLLHQRLAERCDRVIITVAGLPHVLKGEALCLSTG